MRFALLGPVQAGDDDSCQEISAVMPRTVLAVLLLDAGTVVSVDRLAEALWIGDPPASALASLHNHVARLRQMLGEKGGARIRAVSPGYVIDIEQGELDLDVFAELTASGRRAAAEERWDQSSRDLAAALALWRGQPVADVPGLEGRARITQLLEARTQTTEAWIEAELRLGRHDGAIGELRALVAHYPLREVFHGQLMLALYRADRQAEALAVFQKLRRTLVDELGVEPARSIQELHRRILNADPGLAAPAPVPAGAVKRSAVSAGSGGSGSGSAPAGSGSADLPVRPAPPRQLPADTRVFTGRTRELDQLVALADTAAAGGDARTVVISAIDGMAGIGKTALAVHAAHRLAERYPDGQLFIDLHGFTQGLTPREPADALASVLQALGLEAKQIPADLDARAALYRDRLAGTRTLILLDNAAGEAQVRPLLPGGGGCLVLVTSRKRLKALDDAHALPLDVLPVADAVALLGEVSGRDRAPVDDSLVDPLLDPLVDPALDPLLQEIADLCGRLPLALRIAAALVRHRPAWTLERLADRLRDRQSGLDTFFDGDRDLAAVFDLSYTALADDRRQLFCRLGLVPGPDIDTYATAALLGTSLGAAERLLQDLVDHNLLSESSPGRYRLHDLIRVHARTRAEREDDAAQREEAVDRLLDYYQHVAQQADRHLARLAPAYSPAVAHTPRHLPALADREQSDAWMRDEMADLTAAAEHSATRARPTHAVALAAAMNAYLRTHGDWALASALDEAAVASARLLDDRLGQAFALENLGGVRRVTGDYPGAAEVLQQAVDLYVALDNRQGQANALTTLGGVRYHVGDHPGSVEALERALVLSRAVGDKASQANTLANLGNVRWVTGDYAGAAEAVQQSMELFRAVGDRYGQAGTLVNLGNVRRVIGDLPGAVEPLQQALELFRELGERQGQAGTLINLGILWQQTGDLADAGSALQQALDLSRELGDRHGEANALINLGKVWQRTGDLPDAAEILGQALEVFQGTGDRRGEAETLNGCAQVSAVTGDLEAAREQHTAALRLAREINSPQTEAEALEGLGEIAVREDAASTDGVNYLRQALAVYQKLGVPASQRVEARLAEISGTDVPSPEHVSSPPHVTD